jgi:hypothetical protein
VEIAIEGADDAGRDRAVEAEGIADRDDELTLAQRVAVTELDRMSARILITAISQQMAWAIRSAGN